MPPTKLGLGTSLMASAFFALVFVPSIAPAQETAPRALALPAGAQAIELRMHGTWYATEQARDPAVAVSPIEAEQTVLLTADGRYRLRTRTDSPSEAEFKFLTIGSSSGAATVDEMRWNRGIEIQRAGAEAAKEEYADLSFLAPMLLPRNGSAGFKDAAARTTTFALDAGTGRIASVDVGGGRFVYSDYRPQKGGWQQPMRVSQYAGERLLAEWRIDSASAAKAGDAAFRLSAGYVEKSPPGAMRATSLGDGAYRVDGAPSGYHVGFVVGERAIAVFDAPIAVAEARQVKALIESTAPGKPIAYVVVSHPHGDHVGGLAAYLGEGTQTLAGANAGVALRRQLGANADKLRLQEVARPREIDLGGNAIRIYPLDSVHSSAMLVAYAPRSGAVFQGDLFHLPEIGPHPPATPGGVELAGLIEREGLKVSHIVGAHGRSGDAGDLARTLALREKARKSD